MDVNGKVGSGMLLSTSMVSNWEELKGEKLFECVKSNPWREVPDPTFDDPHLAQIQEKLLDLLARYW